MTQPRYSKEAHARRGIALYEQQVRPQVEAGNQGRIVAIDVDSGAIEVADDTLTAAQRLQARCPSAQIWCVRIGYPAVHRFGQPRSVEVDAADAQPLIGMAMLQGSELRIQVLPGRSVTIADLP